MSYLDSENSEDCDCEIMENDYEDDYEDETKE